MRMQTWPSEFSRSSMNAACTFVHVLRYLVQIRGRSLSPNLREAELLNQQHNTMCNARRIALFVGNIPSGIPAVTASSTILSTILSVFAEISEENVARHTIVILMNDNQRSVQLRNKKRT
jgi:hypothetical protein